MRYISTRGEAPAVSFLDAVLAGMAPDGGLYVPERWPEVFEGAQGASIAACAPLTSSPSRTGISRSPTSRI